MKQIVEQYAAAIIACTLAIALWTVLNHGIFENGWSFSKVLDVIIQDSIGEKAIAENDILEEYFGGTALEIQVKNVYLAANQEVSLQDYVTVKNRQNELVPVFLKRGWNSKWESIELGIPNDASRLSISETGVYWVQIYAKDENQKDHDWIIKLLVNER